jgi:hypothetical protein
MGGYVSRPSPFCVPIQDDVFSRYVRCGGKRMIRSEKHTLTSEKHG